MDPQVKLAFEFASEVSKQLITLASGILALSLTFAKDIIKTPTRGQLALLASSWSLYFVSILAGIMSLMALAGNLAPLRNPAKVIGIGDNARFLAGIQIVVFALATLLFIVTGVHSLVKFKGESTPNPSAPPDAHRASRDRRR